MKRLTDIISEKLVINKDSKKADSFDVLNEPIKNIEHFKDILIKFFGNKVIKSSNVSTEEVVFCGNSGNGQLVNDHFRIDIGVKGYKASTYLFVGIANKKYYIFLKTYNGKVYTSCRLNGKYEKETLQNGDNFKEWLFNMQDRYVKKEGYYDINLLNIFGLVK